METIKNNLLRSIVLLLMIALASNAYAFTPVEKHVIINGKDFVYHTHHDPKVTTIFKVNKEDFGLFLNGVACASPQEIDSVRLIEITKWADTPSFTVVWMYVDYNNINRQSEQYLATYKKTGGVIDAVLAATWLEIRKIAEGRYLFPNEGYYYATEISEYLNPAVTLDEKSATVSRKFVTKYGTEKENVTNIEEGEMVTTYSIDNKGKIYYAKTDKRSKRGNKNVLDEATGKMKITEHTDFATLGLGMALIETYTKPSSYTLTPAEYQKIEKELQALEANQEIKASEEANKDLQELKEKIEKWQKNLIYQNPQKWLNWYYKNKTASLDMLKRNIATDANFAKFMSAEVAKIKLKAQRLWWKKHIK